MHADDRVRPLGRLRELRDGKRGGVGREDAILPDDGLRLTDDVLLLERQVLEHRFDDEVRAPEARVVGRRAPSSAVLAAASRQDRERRSTRSSKIPVICFSARPTPASSLSFTRAGNPMLASVMT